MIMSMLYDINFIIGLLITLLLSTFAYFYFSQKIEEQNEKLNAVSMVVRAMAEEMAYFRNAGQSAFLEKAPLSQGGGLAEGGSGQTETKVFEIGLANIGINGSTNSLDDRSNELHLIAVSDDDENSDSSDTDSDRDSDEESGSGSDDDTELCSVSNGEVELEDLEMLNDDLNNQGLTDYKKEENNGDNGNIKSIKLDINMEGLEEFCIFEGLGDTADKLDVTETKVVNVAELPPLIDDDQMKAGSTDYRKMPLSKLRSIVVEKKLCEDASKMKKPELLELLKPFIGTMD
jgi:hypothetical protein